MRRDDHPSLAAEMAAPWWGTDAWREQIRADLAAGLEIAADVVQERHPELPDMGPAVGGIFYGLSAAKVLRKVGYRASRKPSRSGSVIAVWAAGEQA